MLRLLLLSIALAQVPGEAPRVLLEGPSGKIESRPLASFTTADPRELGGWLVRFEGLPAAPQPPAGPESAVVLLAGGDRLLGRVGGGRAELLDVEVAGGVHLGVALDEIESLVFAARVPASWRAPIAGPKEGDRLYRRQGESLDTIDGGVEEFTTDGVRFHGEHVGSKLVPWSDVAALFVESLPGHGESGGAGRPGATPGRPAGGAGPGSADGVQVAVDLAGGSRVRGRLERLDSQGCRLSTRNRESLLLPAAALALVHVEDGAIAFLSGLPPARSEPSRPFGDDLGMTWPARVDRSVGGGALRVAGAAVPRGIGVHAPSRMVWRLDGAWKELRGAAAVDDEVLRLASRGSVVFRVRVDGKTRFESSVIRGGDSPARVGPIDLAGAVLLELEVDPTADSFAADRADWLDLILVR